MPIPSVTIELDKPRHMRLGMGAMVEFEQITGLNILGVDLDRLDMTTTAQLLLAMLRHEDKELTLERVIELIDEKADDGLDVVEIMKPVLNTIIAAFDRGKKSKNGKAPAAK